MSQPLTTRKWRELLTSEQQKKYSSAIRQGYFATYDGYAWRHTFYGAWIWKHPGRIAAVNIFRDIVGHAPDWSDLTDDNLRDFREAVTDHYAPNSAKTILAEVGAVLRENKSSKVIPSEGYGDTLRVKRVPVQSVALTDDEIARIHAYSPRSLVARHVKRIFMLECLCGARVSDCLRLSPANLAPDGRTLTYVSVKTRTEVTVPVHPWLPLYIERTSPREPETVCLKTYTYTIQDICKSCGIDTPCKVFKAGRQKTGPKWKFVTTHTGRRSFATNLSCKGIALEQIAICMGHLSGNVPNIAMTQRYIVGRIPLDAATFQAFNIPGAEQAKAEHIAYNAPLSDFCGASGQVIDKVDKNASQATQMPSTAISGQIADPDIVFDENGVTGIFHTDTKPTNTKPTMQNSDFYKQMSDELDEEIRNEMIAEQRIRDKYSVIMIDLHLSAARGDIRDYDVFIAAYRDINKRFKKEMEDLLKTETDDLDSLLENNVSRARDDGESLQEYAYNYTSICTLLKQAEVKFDGLCESAGEDDDDDDGI